VWSSGGEEFLKGGGKFLWVTGLTFPDDEDFIAEEAEFFEVSFVPTSPVGLRRAGSGERREFYY
jgi:hypothetical protein